MYSTTETFARADGSPLFLPHPGTFHFVRAIVAVAVVVVRLQADDHPRQPRLPTTVARLLWLRSGEEAEGEGGCVARRRGAAARGLRDPQGGEALPCLSRWETRSAVVVVFLFFCFLFFVFSCVAAAGHCASRFYVHTVSPFFHGIHPQASWDAQHVLNDPSRPQLNSPFPRHAEHALVA